MIRRSPYSVLALSVALSGAAAARQASPAPPPVLVCSPRVPPVLQYGIMDCLQISASTCGKVHFMVGLPTAPTDGLLVLFHGQNSDEFFEGGAGNPTIAAARDALMDAAMLQGMHVLSVRASCTQCVPVSSYCITYGGPTMHEHVADAIEYMLAAHGLDRTKVYGFGWSMGGDDVLSYAARHLDVDGHGAMLAAAWARSPTASVPAVWDGTTTTFQDYIEGIVGAPGSTPDTAVLAFAGASTAWIRENEPPSAIDLGRSLAWNLDGRHVMVTRTSTDLADVDLAYYALEWAFDGNSTLDFQVVPGDHGTWTSFDATAVVNYLMQGVLSYPTSGTTLIVENGIHYDFDVQRTSAATIGRWDWNVDSAANQLDVLQASNLSRMAFTLADLGLSTSSTLRLDFDQPSGGATDVVITGYSSQPVVKRCGGLPIPPGTTTWEWDPATLELTLHEPYAYTWCIR